jgi:signal transduction histidine kinase/DNA-binding response OmpR family regulator
MSYQTKEIHLSDEMVHTKVNVLLVDDKLENLISLETLLKGENDTINYLLCRSGEAALKMAIKEEIALILLDVQMPEMDGYEVASLLKKNSKTNTIPIIFVTAIDRDTEEVIQGFESGAVDFLFKPLHPAITKAKVSAFVQIYLQNKELQRKNQLLKENQQVIEATHHLAGIGTWEWDLENDQLIFSENLARLFGFQESKPISGDLFFDTIHPADQTTFKSLLETARREEEYVWYDYRAVVKGKTLYIVGKFKTDRAEDQRPIKVKGYSQDMTSQRESLALLERVFNVSLNAICHLVAVRDEAGTLLDFEISKANQASSRILNRPAEELVRARFLKVLPQARKEGLFEALRQVVENKAVLNQEYGYQYQGDAQWLHLMAVKLEDGLVLSLSDISERKHAEQQLQRAHQELASAHESLQQLNNDLEERVRNRTQELMLAESELRETNAQLRRINADLDNFVYTASHDLKAPINNIEGLTLMVKKHLPTHDEKANRLIFMIEQSISRFKNVLKELTEIAKLENTKLQDVAEVSIKPLIEEARLTIKEQIEQTGARITEELTIPAIRFSRKNLRSIIYNLLSNAVKYRSPQRTPEIAVRTYQDEKGFLVLSVQDNGLGIKAEQIPKMFDIFKRLHSHEEGSGIGLYLVRKIVEDTGGKIEVESEHGVGTTIRILFKLE